MKACMGVRMPFEVGWMVKGQNHRTLDSAAFKKQMHPNVKN